MKKTLTYLLTFVFSFLALNRISAQAIGSPALKPGDYNFKNFLPKIGNIQSPNNPAVVITPFTKSPRIGGDNVSGSQRAFVIIRNGDFDIYQLPIDKMACLVPNKKYTDHMNVWSKRTIVAKMPNGMQRQNWIPGNNGL